MYVQALRVEKGWVCVCLIRDGESQSTDSVVGTTCSSGLSVKDMCEGDAVADKYRVDHQSHRAPNSQPCRGGR